MDTLRRRDGWEEAPGERLDYGSTVPFVFRRHGREELETDRTVWAAFMTKTAMEPNIAE
jgi:hypothetical protein